jgi:hypothetical protein
MDLQTVADLLGVSTRQVNNYINLKGLPSTGTGKRRTFVWSEVLEWYVHYRAELDNLGGSDGSDDDDLDGESSGSGGKENIRQANLRKTRAEANLKELQLGKLRGQVISIPDAKVRLDRMMSNLRARLLGLAPKLSSRIEGEKERTGREAAIKDELETLCREISTGSVVDVPADQADDEVIDEISASAEHELLGFVFTAMNRREALVEANELVRAARFLRDRVKEYWNARQQ